MPMRRVRSDDLEAELNKGALWAVTYGDMMSYMMIFFLVMFSFAVGKGKMNGGGKQSREQGEKLEESMAQIQRVFGGKVDPKIQQRKDQRLAEENIAQTLEQKIQEKGIGGQVSISATEEKVKLVLKEAIVFDSGKAELKSNAGPILIEIIDELKKVPNQIVIEGHTDNVPIRGGRFGSNWELSMSRAYAVIKAFEQAGVDPKRLSGIGYGEQRPVADNATPEGRAANRRIEIELLRGSSEAAAAPTPAPGTPAPNPGAPGKPAEQPLKPGQLPGL